MPLERPEQTRTHGEWHFLIEMCCWRIQTRDRVLIGSDDEQQQIDSIFSLLDLGNVEGASVSPPTCDLHVNFSSGASLHTFTASTTDKEQLQWLLYGPHYNTWVSYAGGLLIQKDSGDPLF